MKIVCLTFDDGTIYDIRFIELLNKYNIKATLNLNSGLNDFVWYYGDLPIKRLDLNKVKDLYNGHEVASHSLTHPYFSSLNKEDAIYQVEEDIKNLNNIFNTNIVGFAFPFSDQTEQNIIDVRNGIELEYIRYTHFTNQYLPKDRYHIPLNAYYNDEKLYDKLTEFKQIELENALFVIVGHSYDFEVNNEWDKIEKLLKYLSEDKELTVLTMKDAVRVLFPA